MAEVSDLVGQMQQLQERAQRHQQTIASGAAGAAGSGGEANGARREGAADAGAAPRRAAAGTDDGLRMGGLDTIDLDGLIESLEQGASLEDPD